MRYAAYGSNLHPRRLERRTGPAKLLGTSRAEGWKLKFHKRGNLDGSGKCNIIRQADSAIHVAIFELSGAQLERLDIAEGVGSGYQRDRVEVPDFGNCLTYLAQATHIDENLKPFAWYKKLVLAGCTYHGFPQDYIYMISRQEAVTDSDADRHEYHMQLVNELD